MQLQLESSDILIFHKKTLIYNLHHNHKQSIIWIKLHKQNFLKCTHTQLRHMIHFPPLLNTYLTLILCMMSLKSQYILHLKFYFKITKSILNTTPFTTNLFSHVANFYHKNCSISSNCRVNFKMFTHNINMTLASLMCLLILHLNQMPNWKNNISQNFPFSIESKTTDSWWLGKQRHNQTLP